MTRPDAGMTFLSCIGLSITARCPISCGHCILEAGPHRKEEMSLSDAKDWLGQAAAYRGGHIQSVIITGGEPFLNRPLLTGILDCAASFGLVPAVMTNAFWARTLSSAKAALRALPQIRMLGVSTDAFHQRFIPLAHAKNALLAARELGIPHSAAVCFENESDPAYENTVRELRDVVNEDQILPAAILPVGRAGRAAPSTVRTDSAASTGACTAADFPTIFPNGQLIGCMGIVHQLPPDHPLNFGSLHAHRLEDLLNAAEANTALHILRIWGPQKLSQLLHENGCQSQSGHRRLNGHCDLCYGLAANEQMRTALCALAADRSLTEKTAYGRLHYLQEETMLRQLGVEQS